MIEINGFYMTKMNEPPLLVEVRNCLTYFIVLPGSLLSLTCTCVCARFRVCVAAFVLTCGVCACLCVCVHVCVSVYVCAHGRACVCVLTCACADGEPLNVLPVLACVSLSLCCRAVCAYARVCSVCACVCVSMYVHEHVLACGVYMRLRLAYAHLSNFE